MLVNPRDLQPWKDLRLTCWVKFDGGEANDVGYCFKILLVCCLFVWFFLIQYNLVLEELLQEQHGGASDGDEAHG